MTRLLLCIFKGKPFTFKQVCEELKYVPRSAIDLLKNLVELGLVTPFGFLRTNRIVRRAYVVNVKMLRYLDRILKKRLEKSLEHEKKFWRLRKSKIELDSDVFKEYLSNL